MCLPEASEYCIDVLLTFLSWEIEYITSQTLVVIRGELFSSRDKFYWRLLNNKLMLIGLNYLSRRSHMNGIILSNQQSRPSNKHVSLCILSFSPTQEMSESQLEHQKSMMIYSIFDWLLPACKTSKPSNNQSEMLWISMKCFGSILGHLLSARGEGEELSMQRGTTCWLRPIVVHYTTPIFLGLCCQ